MWVGETASALSPTIGVGLFLDSSLAALCGESSPSTETERLEELRSSAGCCDSNCELFSQNSFDEIRFPFR